MNSIDPRTCERYCIFRDAALTFAVSAYSVREICELPVLVAIPIAPNALVGLCHFRGEFIPVFSLGSLLGEPWEESNSNQYLIILSGADGSWSIAIDRVVALEELEVALSDCGQAEPTIGTATHHDNVVRVLNADRLQRCAITALDDAWHCDEARLDAVAVESNNEPINGVLSR